MTLTPRLVAFVLAGVSILHLLSACSSTPQVQRALDFEDFSLQPGDLREHGVAFLTPSSITGHEQDRCQETECQAAAVARWTHPPIVGTGTGAG